MLENLSNLEGISLFDRLLLLKYSAWEFPAQAIFRAVVTLTESPHENFLKIF